MHNSLFNLPVLTRLFAPASYGPKSFLVLGINSGESETSYTDHRLRLNISMCSLLPQNVLTSLTNLQNIHITLLTNAKKYFLLTLQPENEELITIYQRPAGHSLDIPEDFESFSLDDDELEVSLF